ncbi:MAG: DUF4956 domain-containing protein [Gemmatimonadaceae bacterium]|nr:DUF4956 domain-containing protein [Gemmatimonadaceae bacterium]
MADRRPGIFSSPATRVLVKVAVYYVVLIAVGALVRREANIFPSLASYAIEPILGVGPALVAANRAPLAVAPDQLGLTVTFIAAMAGAVLLSLPVAWVYQLTRAKRGYQQSVVQMLIILPLVVSGVVVLVKHSLALAFSLAGIVAAVRFRNTLEDSKDAVYVFLATGVGLAAAVDIPVALSLSLLFNVTVLALWYTDFGNSPVELEGSIAARRLKRARQLARTGTFVAQIDNEVLRNMSREQLEGLAQRALKRAHDDGSKTDSGTPHEICIRLRTRDPDQTRRSFELVLGEYAKEWRAGTTKTDDAGVATIDYFVQPKKATLPDEILSLAHTAGGTALVDAQIR